MTKITEAEVCRHADHLGYRLDTVGNGAAEDRWWLVRTYNWMTTDPGRPLAAIKAELEERDGGAWEQREAEVAAAKAARGL